jgi:hypothetical protein
MCGKIKLNSGIVLIIPECGLVIVSNLIFGAAVITLYTDKIVRTALIIIRFFFSISRRRGPGMIRGSPLLNATLGSEEL